MGKLKLFVIESHTEDGWHPEYMHKGAFQNVLVHGQENFGLCIRVRRVKTAEESYHYKHILKLKTLHMFIARTEWVN